MKILVAPLNWGLGHATRCVPIIRQLLADCHDPVIVADGFPLEFLRQEFPQLRFIELTSYSIHYASGKSQIGAMIFSLPVIIKGIIKEHLWLRKLLRTEHFDQIISDNRFGMWHKTVHSVYITHQLMIKMPRYLKFFEPTAHFVHKAFVNRYDECWIPDRLENGGLSGDLSHKYPLTPNAKFIGTLSRFQGLKAELPTMEYSVVAVISGVEPQRTLFENDLIARYKNAEKKTLIVRGQPNKSCSKQILGNLTLVSHLSDKVMMSVLLGATKIICRSGYSSIMDLEALDCLHKAELIPTPGQTEQEYLFELNNIHED